MTKLDETKMAADGHSSVPSPVTPEGGLPTHSPTGADKKKKVNPAAETVNDGVTKKTKNPEKHPETDLHVEEYEDDDDENEDDIEETVEFDISESIASLFEGIDLSEDFKNRASVIFEAAVNEAAEAKAKVIGESIEADLQEQIQSTLEESIEEIIENLDSYLDYVVREWMEENEVAIESGIKVQMAESFMNGLKELFYEHNVEIDEETIDVVSDLEGELSEAKAIANRAINEALELQEELQSLRADRVFDNLSEGLSESQVERFRVLSEKLDVSDLETYESDLRTIKESFFKKKTIVAREDLDREGDEVLTEEVAPKRYLSSYDSVNALAAAIDNLKK
jgi:hypothetical protein